MRLLCIKCFRGNSVIFFALRFGFKALLYYLLVNLVTSRFVNFCFFLWGHRSVGGNSLSMASGT